MGAALSNTVSIIYEIAAKDLTQFGHKPPLRRVSANEWTLANSKRSLWQTQTKQKLLL